MFDRAAANIIATATACAGAAMAVFALGFAVYALAEPHFGPPGSAALVAAIGALLVALYALYAHMRAKAKEREAELAQAQLAESLPLGLGHLTRDHPLAALAVSAIGGLIAARHPRLSRDLISIVARLTGR